MAVASKANAGLLLLPLWMAVSCSGLAQDNPSIPAARSGEQRSAGLTPGQKSYQTHCAMCHGLDGRGGEHAGGIANSRDVLAKTDQAIRQILRGGIPGTGMPSFRGLPDSEIGALVRYLRSLSGTAGAASVKGDPRRGEELFFGKARCGDCHMMAGRGGFIGSDLSDLAVAHSPNEIREAIVRPNEHLEPEQQLVNVETVAGQRLSGLIRNEDNFSLQMQGTDGVFHLLMKSQISKLEHTGQSLMPTDYGTRLSAADLDDVVSYLERFGRRAEAPPGHSGERSRRGRSPKPAGPGL